YCPPPVHSGTLTPDLSHFQARRIKKIWILLAERLFLSRHILHGRPVNPIEYPKTTGPAPEQQY
ncbi:MAG: hypothetical protein UCP03_06775, partial [Alistipes onderdonkii]